MRTKILLSSLLLASLAGAPFWATAQTPSYTTCVTSEQLRHYETVSDPQLSPNGKRVVWVQHESTADGGRSYLWMAPSDGSQAARQITYSPASDKSGESSPMWMPNGSAILFLTGRGKTDQIFRLPMDGGEAMPIMLKIGELALSPDRFAISPNGEWLAFSARQPQTEQQKKDQKEKKDAVIAGQDKNPSRIWLYSLATKEVMPLTPLTREARSFAWNPQSTELAIVTAKLGNADELGPNSKLEVVAVANPNQARPVAGVPVTVEQVRFSPNGEQIAFAAQSEHDTPPGVSDIYVIPAVGGTPRDLTGSSPYAIGRGFYWSKDGNNIYVEVQRHTRRALLEFPLSGQAPAWKPAATPIASDFSTNKNETGWVFVADATDRLPQVVYASSPDAAGAVLSHANADWPSRGWRASATVSWKGPGNLTIYGLYYAPATCTGAAPVSNGKTPMILMAHGGPTGAFTQSFSPFVQWLTTQGWAVLQVNPRGSTGYGWKFTAADRNDLGGKDYEDEMAGVDWALANRPVDPKRLGMFGYSYGGEMAGYIEGKTGRFAAIVAGAPVIDQYSEYGTESGSWYDRWFFGRPWLRPKDAWRQSPLAYAKNAKTPLLLLQGEADTTDPLGQSEEEYRALLQDGVPVRLMKFPRENHGPLAGGILGYPSLEPWHGFEARAQILAWYQEYFQKAATH